MTYPLKFREHVLKVQKEEGLSLAQTSERFKIGRASLVRWHARIDPCLTRDKKAVKIDMQALEEHVRDHPDLSQKERAEHFNVTQSSIHYALHRLGITYKKSSTSILKRALLRENITSKK